MKTLQVGLLEANGLVREILHLFAGIVELFPQPRQIFCQTGKVTTPSRKPNHSNEYFKFSTTFENNEYQKRNGNKHCKCAA